MSVYCKHPLTVFGDIDVVHRIPLISNIELVDDPIPPEVYPYLPKEILSQIF